MNRGQKITVALAATALFCLAMALLTGGAFAQEGRCDDRAAMVKVLADKYQEKSRGIGIIDDKALAELFVSSEKRTWTILVTVPNGPTCIVAAGENWEFKADMGDPM